jgi:hypothetical protein
MTALSSCPGATGGEPHSRAKVARSSGVVKRTPLLMRREPAFSGQLIAICIYRVGSCSVEC